MKTAAPIPSAVIRHDQSEFNVVFVHSALDDFGLSPAQFRIYCHLARRSNAGSGNEGGAWPSVHEIARVCRLHEDTVQTALRWLTSRRLLTCERRVGTTSVYRLTSPSSWLRQAPPELEPPPSVSGDTTPKRRVDYPPETEGYKGYPYEGYPKKEHSHPATASTFVPPTLEEVRQVASLRAIPPECAEKFFHDRDSVGWVNHRGQPLTKWPSALLSYATTWRAFEERQRAANTSPRLAIGRSRPSGAFSAVASAAAFTSTEI